MVKFLFVGQALEFVQSQPRHSHECWITIVYIEGIGTIDSDERSVLFRPGTIAHFPPHYPYAETTRKGFRSIYICSQAPHRNSSPIIVQDSESGIFQRLARIMWEECHRPQPRGETVAQSLLDLLLLYLDSWQKPSSIDPLVAQLKEKLAYNIANARFHLKHAFEEIPASAVHVRKLFRRATGMTPSRYLNELRIGQAKRLLGSRGFSVKEVGRQCGFNDPYYFSRLFRQITGVRPSEYGERVRCR
jgi:AraC-like DNA-binding protein